MSWNNRSCWLYSLAFVAFSALGSVASAGESYYLLMFGSQRIPPNPNYSHSFATFVKVTWAGDGPCPNDAVVESHTISWLPASQVIRTWALLPECGKNFDLETTLCFAQTTDQRISLWGPYCIDRELYCRALKRKADLESGSIEFKAVDAAYQTDRVTNCIHAIAAISQGGRLRITSFAYGETASYLILKELDPWIVSAQTTPWVGSALGLDRYPIIYRDWGNPRSNGVFGGVFRLMGGERDLQPTYGPPAR